MWSSPLVAMETGGTNNGSRDGTGTNTDRSMNDICYDQHTIFCVILSLIRSLSNHFMNCIRNSHEDISHKQIFRIISKVIEVLWCHIEGTIEQLLTRNTLQNLKLQAQLLKNIIETENEHRESSIKDHKQFKILEGPYGRQANASTDIPRGSIILVEQPLSAAPIDCCAEGVICHLGPLLASHLHLTLSIIPSTNKRRTIFDYFLRTFRVPHEGWPTEIIAHFAAISCVLYRIAVKSTIDVNCWDIFQTLQRIPHNAHSIHTLISSSDLSLSQCRIGIGLFPVASTFNHSCVPNVCVKFSRSSEETTLNSNFELELVTTSDIQESEELTITYGPTAQISSDHRIQLLLQQYQFRCTCKLCIVDKKIVPPNLSSSIVTGYRKKIFRIRKDVENILKEDSESIEHQLLLNKDLCTDLLSECQLTIDSDANCSNEIEECICHCYDILGRISAALSDFDGGIMWIQKSIDIFRNQSPHDDNDIIILREKMKIVQMLYLGNKWEECYNYAKKLKKELEPFVDCLHDQDYLELGCMIEYLEAIGWK